MSDDDSGRQRRSSGGAGDDRVGGGFSGRGASGRGSSDGAPSDGGPSDGGPSDSRVPDGSPPDRIGSGEPILRGLPSGTSDQGLAPVIPLFGARGRAASAHPAFGGGDHGAAAPADSVDAGDGLAVKRPRLRPLRDVGPVDDAAIGVGPLEADIGPWRAARHPSASDGRDSSTPDEVALTERAREQAEAMLLRKLRSRSLSLSEARGVVRGIDGVDDALGDEIIDRFVDLGYLDDATFAEQLAMSAVEKRGEGRRAVAETLRKRGIPRDIAEEALAALPDDDAERALDFARSKVRAVEGSEYDAALRRLAGQLARRGYPSSVSLTAARTALGEAGIGRSRSFTRPASGVRFSPDE